MKKLAPMEDILSEIYVCSDADARTIVQNELGIALHTPTLEWVLDVTKYL